MTQLPEVADLSTLGLSRGAIASRAFTVGGSDANIIASGDADRIHRLWEEKTGRVEPEDLSDVLPVQMGNWTEPLNAAWYQKMTGDPVTDRDFHFASTALSWRTATLDGLCKVNGVRAIFEAKHVNSFMKREAIIEKYTPQLMHNMDVMGLEFAVLSVFQGNMDWWCHVLQLDEMYACELLEIETAFFSAVTNDEPPIQLPPPVKPVSPEEMRVLDMTGSNEWAEHATTWLETQAAKKRFDAAAKGLKGLVEADVKQASGHGIIINRSKSNSLLIKEEK